jgi:photosystem II stability/assembly factor-like uncharacterized protein
MSKLLLSGSLLFVLSIVLVSGNITAQGFNSITTPDGVNIVAVGDAGKVYRSASGGVTYTSSSVSGLPDLKCVTSLDNEIWICGQTGNVIKTQKTISPLTTYNTGTSSTLNSITFLNSNTGYVCGDAGVIFKTINGGVNWTSFNSGIGNVKLNSISFDGTSNGIVVGDNGTIYSTSDGGNSWTLENSGTERNLLKVKYFGSVLYAVGEYGTILSGNGGVWTKVITRTDSDIRGLSGTSISDVHVCGGGGFIRNNKNGSSNFFNFEINPMLADLSDILFYDANKAWAVSSSNRVIIYTTNGGTSWSMPQGSSVSLGWIPKTPNASGIGNNLCMHPSNRDAMFVVYGKNVFRSGDKGDNWAQVGTIAIGTRAHSFYVSPLDTNIWVAAMENTVDCIVRSTNYGATWTNVIALDFSTYGQPLEMDQNNPSVFYFAPSNSSGVGVYKSTNNGASFSLTAPYNNSGIGQPCDLIVKWDSPNEIYMGDDGADIYKSIDGAMSWTLVKPNSSSEVPSMCNTVFDPTICYATTWGSTQVFKTVNSGDTWNLASTNPGSGWGSDLCREDPTVVMTGNYGAQAYLSTNGGGNFFTIDSGLAGAGSGIMVPQRNVMLNMQTSRLYKLRINYNDSPVLINIDVQSLSIGDAGMNYYPDPTIIPYGIVKNNNGAAAATFTVTRRISPGGYTSTKTVTNLAASTSTTVNFDQWTFNAGTTYSVRDSVHIQDDTDPGNDVMTGTLTPYLGEPLTRVNQGFTGTFPPSGWTIDFTGTNYWQYNSVSSYGIGVGSAKFNYWSAGVGVTQSMITPGFTPTAEGDSLEYDYSYAPYSSYIDSLIIEASTNNGSTFSSTVVRLFGSTGATGQFALNTTTGAGNFTPAAGQWMKKRWSLPAGTNKIRFRARSGFGNNLYLDSIKVNGGNPYTQFNVTMATEGLFNGVGHNISDTVKAYLRNTTAPFGVIDSSTAVLNSSTLTAPFVFKNAPGGTYYVQILHRNSIEEWSQSGGVVLTRGITGNYDFTKLQSQSYGNNLTLVNSKWCFYSGDVNNDGVIDLTDITVISNNASSFTPGYVVTDLNGDDITDLTDLIMASNNATAFVTKITPMTTMTDIQKMRQDMKEKNIRSYLKNSDDQNKLEDENLSK